jgi:hypothetical protein
MTDATTREATWYVVKGEGEVIAGPFDDPTTAQRLAEAYGPDHVAVPGAMMPDLKAGK